MYDDLVKRIWECASGECFNCSQYQETTNASICSKELLREAADAIEELSLTAESYKRSMEAWAGEAANVQPRWIPVTKQENLPNTDSGVVGYFGGGAFDQLRWYDFVRTLSDGSIVSENTERDVLNEHCIAVFKLPEPPKEE